MLTCKSLFGLGYRGERLIEPLYETKHQLHFDGYTKVVKKDAEKASLSEEFL